jgi:hypothetical protein
MLLLALLFFAVIIQLAALLWNATRSARTWNDDVEDEL